MKMKNFFLSLAVIVLLVVMFIPQSVFATTSLNPPIILGITAKRPGGFGYSIGGRPTSENTSSARLWDIVRYDSDSSSSGIHRDIDIFCLNAKYGFGNTSARVTYDTKYDMKTEKNRIMEKSTREDLKKLTGENYNAILALGDMLYVKGQSEAEKTSLLRAAGIESQNWSYQLTDDDIWAVEQSALWFFTNGQDGIYDKREEAASPFGFLYYTAVDDAETNPTSYNQLSDYKRIEGEGPERAQQAGILYNYLIATAQSNASRYENSDTNSEVPVTVKVQSKYEEKDSRYIIGPIKITETENKIPYTVGDIIVKNGDSIITDYTIVEKEGDNYITVSKRGNELVGDDFYVSVPKQNDIESIKISSSISYTKTTLNLWTHGTSAMNQPVLIPEKEKASIPLELTITPDEKIFDLALRKYITKITSNGVTRVLSDSDDTTRVPEIEESTLTSGTTATYKHRKDPVPVETGDIVTYNITIYNEGEKSGRATQVIDQLPTGLKFKRVVSGNFNVISTSVGGNSTDDTNTIRFARKADNTDNLPAYTEGNLASETIEIECEVTATPDARNQKILTNVAWISSEYDAETDTEIYNQDSLDRDSKPATHPDVDKDSMSNYRGKSTNKSSLDDKYYHYEGEQDDDDFEKLVLDPKEFDLRLKKYISAINGDTSKGKTITKIDTTKLASKTSTDADFTLSKNVVAVKHGDYVTYTFRVYNEGDINGYVTKITDNIPLGLQFVQAKGDGKTITIYTYSVENGITSEDKEVDTVTYNLINANNAEWTIDREGTAVKTDTYDGDITPSISLDVENYLGGTNTLLEAYKASEDINKDGSTLKYVDLTVVLRVSEDADLNKVIRNEAAITGHTDETGDATIIDRDSQPENWPGKDDHDKYQDDEDYDNIILKPFDLALRKFIIAVSDDETIENSEYLRKDGKYTRQPVVDTTKLNTTDSTTGKLITTATYNHPKEPVEVKKGDIVVYMLRVYNEGDIDGYAAEIKDHLPSNLEFVEGEYNRQYGWSVSEDGKTVTTRYLENQLIKAAKWIPQISGGLGQEIGNGGYELSYKEVPIMCKVKETAKVDEKITNIADITKYLDEDKQPVVDRDSQEDNVDVTEGNKPEYRDTEIDRGDTYIPGQQDDDDFEKVIIPKFDLALRKQITSIYNTFNKKETKYSDRYAKLDNSKNNTIYDYYDVDSNKPTVVENDVVTYSIRVYNEGKVDGKATWVTDRLPSGLQYLPDDETNKEYKWKAYKQSSADSEKAIKIGEKYYEEVSFDSNEIYMYATEYLNTTTIKAYTGEGEATYGEVFMTTRVKAKSEVAEGTEYKLRNIAEIGDDDNDDYDSVPGDESEWQDQDDVDVEDLKLVEFDLALRKWVTQAIVIDSKGQTVTETGHQPYDDPEQVVKVELHRRKLNEVTVKFRYSIRIINEGDIAGYAKEIKDYIPQGLKFVAEDNPGWTDEGNNIITTKLLEGTLLQPGEFADVEVLLTWINSENNMGVMVNTAEISRDYNEYGVPDRDSIPDNKKPGEDDIDDAPVMLSISTGQMRIYFVLGFAVLITVAGGVVLIKKYVL